MCESIVEAGAIASHDSCGPAATRLHSGGGMHYPSTIRNLDYQSRIGVRHPRCRCAILLFVALLACGHSWRRWRICVQHTPLLATPLLPRSARPRGCAWARCLGVPLDEHAATTRVGGSHAPRCHPRPRTPMSQHSSPTSDGSENKSFLCFFSLLDRS